MEVIDVNTLFGPLPAASADLTLDALRGLMEKHGVSTACTLSTLGLLLDPIVGNAATRAACSEYDDLLPTATLNPALWFGAAQNLQTLASEGFRLVRFFPERQKWPLEFGPFRALVRALAPTGLPIMIAAGETGNISALETTLDDYSGPVILANVSIVNLAETITALRSHSQWHVEISRLLAPGCLRLLVDAVGAERLLFGTGAPAQPVASVLNVVRHAELSPDAEALILAGNARRLLRL